jgi:hypothetical protein
MLLLMMLSRPQPPPLPLPPPPSQPSQPHVLQAFSAFYHDEVIRRLPQR